MPEKSGAALFVALWSLLSACDEAQRPATVVSDSSGVRIITTGPQDFNLAWAFVPEDTLGGKGRGEESFYTVTRATIAVGDRGIYVWDPAAHVVRAFDRNGRYRWSAGREGGGPGEIRFGNSIAVDEEDRTYVYDGAKEALVVFGPLGKALPEVPFPVAPIRAWRRHFDVHPHGFVFWRREPYLGRDQRQTQLLWTEWADTLVLVSTWVPLSRTARLTGCPLRLTMPVLGAPRFHWDRVDRRVAVNTVADYVINVFDSGVLTLSIRRDIPANIFTEDTALEAYSSRAGTGPIGGMCQMSPAEMLRKFGHADKHQVLDGITVGPDGSVWALRGGGKPGAPGRIDVFDRDGAYVGTLPEGTPFPLIFLDGDRVAFATRDSFDVERLVLARLVQDGRRLDAMDRVSSY